MASVEELCDEISLINKSHNILSGNVRELRERFSRNAYELQFVGAPTALENIEGATVTLGEINPDGFASADIVLDSPDRVRDFIAQANQLVTIESFRRRLCSMDNIFVSAVKESDRQFNTENEAI